MRLIDADALVEEMGAGCLPIFEKGISEVTGDEDSIKDYVDRAPTIDAVPVIYCKDCYHARPLNLRELMVFDSGCFVCTSQYGAGTSCPEYEMTGKVVFPKSFCSYAHRRTNGRR